MSDPIAYRYPHVVAKVERVDKTVSGHKTAAGGTETVTEPLGWFVTLDPGGIAYPVGDEKPALKVGDCVDLVLRPAAPITAAGGRPSASETHHG